MPLPVILKIQMGSATAVMLEAIPETSWPSQMINNPLMPFGRGNEKSEFLIVQWTQHITAESIRQPLQRHISINVISIARWEERDQAGAVALPVSSKTQI